VVEAIGNLAFILAVAGVTGGIGYVVLRHLNGGRF
jgi:hypothetical protein